MKPGSLASGALPVNKNIIWPAVSDQTLAGPLRVVGLDHEQPVPIFQRLAGGHPPGCDATAKLVIARIRLSNFHRPGGHFCDLYVPISTA